MAVPFAAAVFAVGAPANAAGPEPVPGASLVGVRVEYYEADAAELRALVVSHEETIDASGLRADLLAKVSLGEARLVDSAYVVTRSGQRAKVESVAEWISPTEWDPPNVTGNLSGPIARGVDLITPLTPTMFETRNLGLTLEVDPVAWTERALISLNLAPEVVVRLGENSHGQGECAVEHPVFHNIRSRVAISLRSGDWVLLGIHAPPPPGPGEEPPADRRVACLVQAGLLAPGNPETTERSQGWEESDAAPVDVEAQPPNPPTLVSLVFDWYELDALAATRLLDEHPGPWADTGPLLERLEAMAGEGMATHLDSAYLVTRSGQRTKSESVREWIYPPGAEPPGLPQDFTGPVDPEVQIQTHLSYTAFETRNVGTTVETDPVIGPDGVTIDLVCAPEIVRLGATVFHGRDESRADQPVFYTMKVQSAVTLHDGTSMLAGMHSPMPEDVTAPNFGSELRVLLVVSGRLLEVK